MSEMSLLPLVLSGKLALVTTVILVVLAAPLAYVLHYARFRGKSLLEALVNLPLVLPPTVLGFYLLILMGPKGAAGRFWEWLTRTSLVFSFQGIVFASIICSLPFAFQPMKTAFSKIDKRLIESAYVLGLSRISTFFRVVLPNSIGGIAAAAILVFIHTIGEFGVILMVGGSIPGKTKVVSIAIYEAVEALHYREAGIMSLSLLPVCYAVLIFANLISERKSHGALR
ncbi:MAG: molybdate ABC transporter permease subunit [Pseudomonadota bacterium]